MYDATVLSMFLEWDRAFSLHNVGVAWSRWFRGCLRRNTARNSVNQAVQSSYRSDRRKKKETMYITYFDMYVAVLTCTRLMKGNQLPATMVLKCLIGCVQIWIRTLSYCHMWSIPPTQHASSAALRSSKST